MGDLARPRARPSASSCAPPGSCSTTSSWRSASPRRRSGTLLPILHDAGVLRTPIGPSILSVGAIGEFGPIVAVAVLLTNRDPRLTFLLLAALRRRGRGRRPPGHAGPSAPLHRPPAQAPPLDRAAACSDLRPAGDPPRLPGRKLSLDVLLGAFAAGVVVRLFIKGEDSAPITSKLEAIGFGFLIPIFFIDSGINFDLHALIHMPKVLLLVPMFTVIFLFTRGLPTWAFFRGVVTKVEARTLAVLSATGLPIIVVITTLGVSEHRMKPQNAAALVAAGMLSVLMYPLVGLRWLGKGAKDAIRSRDSRALGRPVTPVQSYPPVKMLGIGRAGGVRKNGRTWVSMISSTTGAAVGSGRRSWSSAASSSRSKSWHGARASSSTTSL